MPAINKIQFPTIARIVPGNGLVRVNNVVKTAGSPIAAGDVIQLGSNVTCIVKLGGKEVLWIGNRDRAAVRNRAAVTNTTAIRRFTCPPCIHVGKIYGSDCQCVNFLIPRGRNKKSKYVVPAPAAVIPVFVSKVTAV